MFTRLIRIQLLIFAIVTVLAVGGVTLFYLKVPQRLGAGTYVVDAELASGGGIYNQANVTYRGATIGRVEKVGLNQTGVATSMRLNSNTPVPDNVIGTVQSMSAVGEQFIDFTVPKGQEPSATALKDGAKIGQDRMFIGQDIAGMLQQADKLVTQHQQRPAAGPSA